MDIAQVRAELAAATEPLPCSREEALGHLHRIWQLIDPELPLADLEPGLCDECQDDTMVGPRWRLGQVALCRSCLLRRRRIGGLLEAA